MLATDERALFLDALRPPEGYRFDRGIGTTFTLDLLTLLIAPLSLALLEVSDTEAALNDPILLLEGLSRYASRMTIFCHAGRIAIPNRESYLYHFLENMVVEVQAPRGGVFHPKVWLLRYTAEAASTPPLYRFLNLSRNLTFDRSWDLMLRLEGELAARQHAFARNHPLGDFVQVLPDLAVHSVSPRVAEDIALLQDEVRRVAFRVPDPFAEELAFYPSGIPGHRGYQFDENHFRAMVVSPFLGDRVLQRITSQGNGHVLISRMDSMDALTPGTLSRFDRLYVLDDQGLLSEEPDPSEAVGQEVLGVRPEPLGLHAKLFILETGWDAKWLVGSANATETALSQRKNVEFMVELSGRRSTVGIDKVLGADDDSSALRALLRPFTPGDTGISEDQDQQRAEDLANHVREWLVALKMRLEVEKQETDRFRLVLHRSEVGLPAPDGLYAVVFWPITLRSERALPLFRSATPTPDAFSDISLLTLTPFVAFEVRSQVGGYTHALCFVLNLPISGIPEEDRKAHVFRAIIGDRGRFLRYLWLLLEAESGDAERWTAWATEGTGSTRRAWEDDGELPLLEILMRALSRSLDKIDRIAQLVEGLKRTPDGQAILPDGFEALWDAVLQTRSGMQ